MTFDRNIFAPMKSNSAIEKVNCIAIFDIDGTLRRTTDPWMLLHNHLGIETENDKYYKAWMSHEISYPELAALWKGIHQNEMEKVMKQNPVRRGAENLIQWFKSKNIPCVGISSGVSLLNQITANQLGLDEVISNEILFENGICTGQVKINVEENTKQLVLERVLQKYHINQGTVISFGDGQADIAMFNMSAISFAIFPKSEMVSKNADYIINTEPIDCAINYLPELTF